MPGFFILEEPLSEVTRKCSRTGCNNRFTLNIRAGRNSGKATSGRKHSCHNGRRYCSDTCRKLASKARRTLQSSPQRKPAWRRKPRPATYPLSIVTNVLSQPTISMAYEGQKSGRGIAQNDLWRLQRRAGRGMPEYVPGQATGRQPNRYSQPDSRA
jgi:hypothetical protein